MRPTTRTKYVTVHSSLGSQTESSTETHKGSFTPFERNYLIISSATMITIIFTLITSVWLAFIQQRTNEITAQSLSEMRQSLIESRRANDLTRQTIEDSKIPWLDIQFKSIGQEDNGRIFKLVYSVENKSDYPANDYNYYFDFIMMPLSGKKTDSKNDIFPTKRDMSTFSSIMPHSIRTYVFLFNDPQGTLYEHCIKDHWICSGVFTFSDIFGHKLGMEVSYAYINGGLFFVAQKLSGYFPKFYKM